MIVTENGVAAAPVEEDVLAPALVQDAEPAPPAPVAESSDPFLDHYQPAPAAAVAPAAPEVEDPRVAWRKKNQDELKGRGLRSCAWVWPAWTAEQSQHALRESKVLMHMHTIPAYCSQGC